MFCNLTNLYLQSYLHCSPPCNTIQIVSVNFLIGPFIILTELMFQTISFYHFQHENPSKNILNPDAPTDGRSIISS